MVAIIYRALTPIVTKMDKEDPHRTLLSNFQLQIDKYIDDLIKLRKDLGLAMTKVQIIREEAKDFCENGKF